MPTATPTEPCAKGTIFSAFKKAALDLYGEEGLADIARRMTEEVRRNTVENVIVATDFLPERYVMEWYDAVYEGPAGEDLERFLAFIRRMMDHGFGRVQRFVLQVVPPEKLADRAAHFWRTDHTHGELLVEKREQALVLTLKDHPYLDRSLSRSAIAEIYRYALSLSRARGVLARHERGPGGELVVHLSWE